MAENPSIEELRELYKDVLENEDVSKVSNWTLPNFDKPTNEDEYAAKAKKFGKAFTPVEKKIIEDL